MTKSNKNDVIIVGSGLAGATIARELSLKGKDVLILEKGPKIHKITAHSLFVEKGAGVKKYRTFKNRTKIFYGKEGNIYSKEKVEILRALVVGGTTHVTAGNATRPPPKKVKALLRVDLEKELKEAEKDLSVNYPPENKIGKNIQKAIDAANELGYQMKPMGKCVNWDRCYGCGNCFFGCPVSARWSSESYLDEAIEKNSRLLSNVSVEKIITQNEKAIGVRGLDQNGPIEFFGDTIIVAAGGVGTPIILQKSGIENAGTHFWADLCRNTSGVINTDGFKPEHPTPAFYDGMLEEKGFLITPFSYPNVLLYFLDFKHKHYDKFPNPFELIRIGYNMNALKKNQLISFATKIEDEPGGIVYKDGTISKKITEKDQVMLDGGSKLAKEILIHAGCKLGSIFDGKTTGYHPGGTAALGTIVDSNFETKAIKNLYVCDASVIPESLGVPPLLTIVALAKYFAKNLEV